MRARKLAAVVPEDLAPREDVAEAWAEEEDAAASGSEPTGPIAQLCLECGAAGCREHDEIARLDEPSRVVLEAVARLRRTAAEHRAATRSLRVLVLSEVARGRGDFETRSTSDLETRPASPVEPCPRCSIRDAEAALLAAGATKGPTRRARRENDGQQALPFKAP